MSGPAARDCDVLVVGAGPAGLAAALAAVDAGARVELLDGYLRAGGQYWRHGAGGPHHARRRWSALTTRLAAATAAGLLRHRQGAQVWRVEVGAGLDGRARVSAHAVLDGPAAAGDAAGERAVSRSAAALVLATGAHDLVLPFPGWDLPGVLTAGAAQALLSEHGVLAGHRVVVGGSGPFLLPVAAALATAGSRAGAGGRVLGVFEAGDGRGWRRGWRAVAGHPGALVEGAGHLAVLARHRVPVRLRAAVVAAHGTDRVEAVTVARLDASWRVLAGTARRVRCDAVAVSWGFSPRLELALQAGCATRPGPGGVAQVVVDALGRSSVPGVLVAGEPTGVGGALLAGVEGELAGRAAAAVAAGRQPGPAPRRELRRRRALGAFAATMQAAHPVRPGWMSWLQPDTLICRCEEVAVAQLHAAVDDLGAADARTARLLTRCGMGWCQGRMCSEAVAALVCARGDAPADQAPLTRPLAVPLTLAQLAALDPTGPDPTGDPR